MPTTLSEILSLSLFFSSFFRVRYRSRFGSGPDHPGRSSICCTKSKRCMRDLLPLSCCVGIFLHIQTDEIICR
jgi:hypothetical protein